MPLSEDEQRILQEIEAQFYATDPELAQQVSSTTVYRYAARNIKWSMLGLLAGFAVLVWSFASSAFLGFVGFVAMVGFALLIERNLRKLGRAGLQSMTSRWRATFGDAGRQVRGRLRKDES